ncbi:hypothetical protein E4U43_001874 [Claviceps pusilla]|uniref:Uncharacterized protein n=1 Tax=Claviceps pusilla TaxID=123648 RepID=A0A9P7T2C5_9HYPO|nr:hypothetical protein E4U43_001874 [Claviceps pusilla]
MLPAEHLTAHQIHTVTTLERVGGLVSLVAVALILLTNALVRRVRNVQNTFIVFASLSNVGASIAYHIILISSCHDESHLILIHPTPTRFMQSDPWWSLAMAINVLLVFYFRASPDSFRQRWWIYASCATVALCPCAGVAERRHEEVQRGRRERNVTPTDKRSARPTITTNKTPPFSRGFISKLKPGITTSFAASPALSSPRGHHNVPSAAGAAAGKAPAAQYFSAAVSATPSPYSTNPKPDPRHGRGCFLATALHAVSLTFFIEDPIKRAYLLTSLLFALSVLVTWIPSSLNRIYGRLEGQSPYQFHVATAAVLPLQGLWNSVIFFLPSWRVVQALSGGQNRQTIWVDAAGSLAEEGAWAGDHAGERDAAMMGSDVELRSVDMVLKGAVVK